MTPQQVLFIPSSELGWVALRAILDSLHSIVIIGEATSPEQARQFAARVSPDVILSAAVIDDTSALPLLAELRHTYPSSIIAVFVSCADIQELGILSAVRINGYLVWSDLTSSTKLRHTLSAILNGIVVSSETVVETVSVALAGQQALTEDTLQLTPRERAVLTGLAQGLTRQEIAATTELSVRTVNRTITLLEEKFAAPTPFLLGMKAAQLRLIP